MYYFAFDLTVSRKELASVCPGFKPLFRATLPNYKLVFTGWSRKWRGGAATIKASRGDKVPGAIYEGTDRDFQCLDRYEGCPSSFNRLNVLVFDEDGNAVKAITYIKSGQIEETAPSKDYALIMQQGYKEWGII